MKSAINQLILLAGVVLSTVAWGQNASVAVGTGSELPGATGVTIPVNLTAGQNIASIDLDVTLTTAANYTNIAVDCGAATVSANLSTNCSVTGNVVTIQMSETQQNIWISGLLANITFDVPLSATATLNDPLVADVQGAGDNAGDDLATLPTATNGTFTVQAGPQPAFTGTPTGLAMSAGQGDPDPTGSLAITNSGAATTTLTGTCTLTSGDTEISVTNGGFSVAQGAPAAVVGVACDASAQGSYAATLSCTHDGSSPPSPVTYDVTCDIAAPGAAVYQSSPAAGSIIEMTPEDVPVNAVVPDQVLTITNGAVNPNNSPLNLSCAYSGSAEITVSDAGLGSPIAPNASATATFSCDTAAVGTYTGTYTCDYSVDGSQTLSETASYTVNCGVRAAESALGSSPDPDSTLNMSVPIGGSGSAFINVFETNDEGVDATIDSCSLADGTNFTIITTFPLTVPAGGSVQIEIEGTDPGDGSLNITDTITCTATDSSGTSDVSWDLNMSVQTTAIPTLSTWGLLAMFLTMLGLGGIALRRKTSS